MSESKIVGGIGGGPVDDGVTKTGIQTFPPDVAVKPGPLPPKEIRTLLKGAMIAPRGGVIRPGTRGEPDDISEEEIERLCLTWRMWQRAEDKVRSLGDLLGAALQDASNQRAIAEVATKDAVSARAQLGLSNLSLAAALGFIREGTPAPPSEASSPDPDVSEPA